MAKLTKEYTAWLKQLKDRVRSAQVKAALKVNAELLSLYWDLGTEILYKETSAKWGDGWLYQLAGDLSAEFPDIKGFSHTNLKYIRRWVTFYSNNLIGQQPVAQLAQKTKRQQLVAQNKKIQQPVAPIIPQLVGQIPWGHHLQIITKCKDIDEALFYIAQTTQHNWSRSVLVHQMESGLYKRKGKAFTNFEYTLPKPQSDLANELLKSPYNFDFLQLGEEASERGLEDALIEQLIKFLLELGSGFAFMGRQRLLVVDHEDFFLDLLFYHTQLHCYVVVELKIDNFKPEYAGKLNFYLSAVDAQLKTEDDQPSIGLLLCKKAGKLIVEYSLKNISKPIGVSEYQLTESIPAKLKGKLPTIKQIEKELKNIKE
ncbi:MAG: PDDEXK nuclease domain-containing protein [Chitinophagaceae bacterium]